MREKSCVHTQLRWIVALAAFFAFSACSFGPAVVDHAFSFDAISDSSDVYVLDYRYGDSKLPMVRNPEHLLKEGRSLQSANIIGPMKQGDSLYVKWRIKSTGQIYEDTVDLRSRLPADITDHKIYFIIQGPQLYVYLISPERRPPDVPRNGPRAFSHLRTTTIYPAQPKP
jgi:hypothetical protein